MTESEHPISMTEQSAAEHETEQVLVRKQKLAAWRKQTQAFPNDFSRTQLAQPLLEQFAHLTAEQLEKNSENQTGFALAGRLMTRRLMGKASFIHLQDMSGRIQVYIAANQLGEDCYEIFKTWDLGDIVGITGHLFITKTGELTLKAHQARLLCKALRPLPDKFHGLTDHEQRFRQRYLDLLTNTHSRQVFVTRSKLISTIRRYFDEQGFMEVETPMMHAQPGGAVARPFITHHNALDIPLFLRIAPELYLKRLVVGGFEKVYELNRNFRNEGVSTRHNPEFTMLEFYQAYADYHQLMDFTEQLLRHLAQVVLGHTTLQYQGTEIDLAQPFARMSMRESIQQFCPEIPVDVWNDLNHARQVVKQHGVEIAADLSVGQLIFALFEKEVEHRLIQPTFITEYPIEVSPLARANDQNPSVVDRFEFYLGGREVANGFSELNDPEDQAHRFELQCQARDAGDEEAMHFDHDYITALEYGLPPTAGEGIGIDRLAMVFSDCASIRDVILFPLLRNKESK